MRSLLLGAAPLTALAWTFLTASSAGQALQPSLQTPAPQAPPSQADPIVRGGVVYPSFTAWAASPGFRAQGLRCKTPATDLSIFQNAIVSPSDCSAFSTNPSTDYAVAGGTAYEIPVVFHVLQRTNGTGFISAATLQQQIDILNEDFGAQSGTPGAGGFDTGISFVLATTDPNGNPTTGITYSSNNTWYDDGGSYWNTLAWDPDNYLNVYTNNPGALGYVPFLPASGTVGSNADRVVVDWSTVGRNAPFGAPYNQGRTLTHEVGHYLGLEHTFAGGCGSTSSCFTTGDLICDTNGESAPSYGCALGSSSCGSTDPVRNYMNYSDDTCMNQFTQQQTRRMRCTLETRRTQLWNTGGGGGPTGCELADAFEPNGTCALATPIASSTTLTNLTVQKTTDDWFTITLAAGATLDVDALFTHGSGDIDLELFDACGGTQVDQSETTSDNESVSATGPGTFKARVFVWSGSAQDCNDYSLSVTIVGGDPCTIAPDDALEPNDTCAAAASLGAGSNNGLFVSKSDEDWYEVSVPSGATFTANMSLVNANGDIDLELFSSCGSATLDTAETTGDTETVTWTNAGATTTVQLRVLVWAGSTSDCNDYDLSLSIVGGTCTGPDDSLEPNDSCGAATSLTSGTSNGLYVEKTDTDWYTVNVPSQATLDIDALFVDADGDLDLVLLDACGGTQLALSESATDNESVSYTNTTGASQDVVFEVYVWVNAASDCNSYDLSVDVQGGPGPNLQAFCFGDGSGTNCPCNNNSNPGHEGGCANSVGDGAILLASGTPSVMADSLRFDVVLGSPSSFGLLVSANNQLPQTGNIGEGIQAFDGLRCVGGGFLRHGARALDSFGQNTNPWGPPGGPAGGLINAFGFVVGQTRHFQVFYRDDTGAVCGTGQNTSNAITVTIEP